MNQVEGDGRIYVFPHGEFGFGDFFSGDVL